MKFTASKERKRRSKVFCQNELFKSILADAHCSESKSFKYNNNSGENVWRCLRYEIVAVTLNKSELDQIEITEL